MAVCGTDVFVWAPRKMWIVEEQKWKVAPRKSNERIEEVAGLQANSRQTGVIMAMVLWNFGDEKAEWKVKLNWQQKKLAGNGKSKEGLLERPGPDD